MDHRAFEIFFIFSLERYSMKIGGLITTMPRVIMMVVHKDRQDTSS